MKKILRISVNIFIISMIVLSFCACSSSGEQDAETESSLTEDSSVEDHVETTIQEEEIPDVENRVILAEGERFIVEGSRIMTTNGQELVLKGTNINGPNWVWDREVTQDADLIIDTWKFNSVRVNCYVENWESTCYEELDKIVDTFTDRHIVVMIEAHDKTGKYFSETSTPALQQLIDWHVSLAEKYKDNSYVWFNVMNEPGNKELNPQWLVVHDSVIKAVRDTGADNIIVCDGHTWGQDVGKTSGAQYVTETDSAILAYGPQLTEKYDNVIFSVHSYGWGRAKEKLEHYIDSVHAKNMALIFGEIGIAVHKLDFLWISIRNMLETGREKNVGRMVWHWDGGDANDLTINTTRGGGYQVDKTNGAMPTNLSWFGDKIWRDNYNMDIEFVGMDIAVTDIRTNTEAFAIGDKIEFTATIKNTGEVIVSRRGSFTVRFLVDGKEIGTGTAKGELRPYQTIKINSPEFTVEKESFTVEAVFEEQLSKIIREDNVDKNNRLSVTIGN